MDFGTLVGIVLGFGFVLVAITMHGSLKDFVDIPGAMVAFGGSSAALVIMFPAKKVLGLFGITKNVFSHKLPDPKDELVRLTNLASVARRDGLLALEKQ